MGAMASQITSLTIVYATVYSDADQRKLQRSASLAFVREIHRGPVNSPHKWPVTRKMVPFDEVIMEVISFYKKGIPLCHYLTINNGKWIILPIETYNFIMIFVCKFHWIWWLGNQLTILVQIINWCRPGDTFLSVREINKCSTFFLLQTLVAI